MPRSSPPRAALPPTDHVARELLKRGARDPAMLLLRAAIRRDPGERACAALIKALEARPDAAVSGPELVLDLRLVDDYVSRGMLLEARAVLSGTQLDAEGGPGAERAHALDDLLAPIPDDAETGLREAFRHLTSGGASLSLSLIEEHLQAGNVLPPWARHRRKVLRRLLLDRVLDSTTSGEHVLPGGRPPTAVASASRDANDVASDVGRLIHERDLRGAASRLTTHCAASPHDIAAAVASAALDRLLRTLDVRDGPPTDALDTRTAPMNSGKVADLNVRMGNLAEAERLYRRTLLDDAENVELRNLLDDVRAVARFVDSPAATAPTPHAGVTRSLVDAVVAEISVRATERLPIVDDASVPEEQDVDPRVYTEIGGDDDELDAETSVTAPPEEVTRSVLSSQISGPLAASRVQSPTPSSAAARADALAGPQSAPALSKKSGPSGGFGIDAGYAPTKPASTPGRSWADDDATGVVEPAVEAELLLRQGFAARALATYQVLAQHNPTNEKYARRVTEIEALIAGESSPLPGDLTVRRDLSELQRMARPTGLRLTLPDEVRAVVVASSSAALPGTLDAPGLPPGQFDDDIPTSLALGRGMAPPSDARMPTITAVSTSGDAVLVSRILVVR